MSLSRTCLAIAFTGTALVLSSLAVCGVDVLILDATSHEPLSGAMVKWTAHSITGGSGVSDAKGIVAFSLDATGSPISLTVSKQGFAPTSMNWAPTSVPKSYEFLMPPAQRVAGRCVDPGGHAIAGATVRVVVPQRLAGPSVPDEALTVKTDANGEWRCDAVPRHSVYLLVEASHPDYAFNNHE